MSLKKAHSPLVATCCLLCVAALFTVFFTAACNRSAPANAGAASTETSSGATSPANNSAAGASADVAQLGAEIERLEKQAERNPSDEGVRESLSQAYVRRGNALRAAQQVSEALRDYRNALRINEDNEEAQRNAAEIAPQVEGEATGENGEPAPLPITPNVTTEGEDPTPTQQPTPPKKKDKQ